MAVGDVLDREERPPLVRFEKRAIEDKAASREAGQIIYKDVDWVLVTPPYSKDCYEQKVEKWFSQVQVNVRNGRTPQQWLDLWQEGYKKWKQGEEMPLNGTSVKNWSAISQAQCKTLLAANILTIEDLALVNDQGLRRLGMGGLELKNKAKAYVQATKDTGPLVMENASLKKTIAQQNATISNLTDKLEILTQRLGSMQSQPLTEVTINNDEITGEDLKIEWDKEEIPESSPKETKFSFKEEKTVVLQEKSLEEQYIEKFGKKPHHLMKEATIRRKLEDAVA